jgi:penicillin-binding protein 1A
VVLLLFTEVTERTILSAAERAEGSVGVELIKPDEVRFPELEQRSEVFDRDGQSLAVLDREVNRQVIPLDRIPEHARQAVIAAEDRRFYEHHGYDPEGIARALRTNVQNGGVSGALSGQGGSTLTQQLAKSLVGTEDSVERKVTELTYAMRLEEEYTKDELLEQYLNQVYFGANAYGVAAAAEEYFRTPSEALTVPQAALIAGLISVPNNANPRTEPEKAKVQRDTTLDAMAEEGYITVAEAEQFRAQPLGVAEPLLRTVELPFVVQAVQNEFLTSPRFAEFGETFAERQEALDFGGLKITATIDPRLQDIASAVLMDNFGTDPSRVTGAIATVEPVSGKILAAQGAIGFDDDRYDLATQGRRQPGSTFKPFIYATALQQGLPVGIQLEGTSPSFYEDVPGWTEEDEGIENYGDRSYPKLDMRAALRSSVNTAAAQLIQIVGAQSVWDTADAMGIDMLAATRGADGEPIVVPAIGLGGLEHGVSPLEMATGYATFANDGIAVEPTIIERITDQEGDVLYNGEPLAARILDSRVNATMVSMMTGVVTGGTGTAARISGWQVAGKTGTTTRSTDAWFVGYTPTLSTAMWMGYKDDNRRSTGQTGGGKPAGVWRQYMVQALAGTTPVGFPEVAGSDSGSGRLVAGEPVTVPDIRRLTATEAYRTLLDLKLIGQRVDVGSEAPAGTVLWQSPRAGTAAETGDEVRFGVSTGQPAAPEPEEGSSSDSSDSSSSDSSSSDSSDAGSSDSSSESGDATGSASDSIELPAEDTGD